MSKKRIGTERGLWVVVGKGGVGKTVVAAAFGRALAKRGLRSLVIEVDPRESLDSCFGVAPSAGEMVDAGPAHAGVRLLNLKPRAAFDAFAREKLRPHLWARPWIDKALDSPAYERFVEAAPGLAELAILGQTQRFLKGDGGLAPMAPIPPIPSMPWCSTRRRAATLWRFSKRRNSSPRRSIAVRSDGWALNSRDGSLIPERCGSSR